MTFFKELSAEDTIETITGVQFCLLSPEEIRRRSVCEIRTHDIYSGNEPVQGGVLDARMGVLDNNRRCPTCGNKNTFCPGHFGHVELAKPVFYVQFMEAVKRLMRCVCFRCSALLFEWNDKVTRKQVLKLVREKRFEFMYKHCNKSTKRDCPFCKARQPSLISRDIFLKIVLDWKKDNLPVRPEGGEEAAAPSAAAEIQEQAPPPAPAAPPALEGPGPSGGAVPASAAAAATTMQIIMYPEDVERVLRRISDEDCEVLGFSATMNRPEWMICRAFPVPPPCVRPTVHNDIGQRREDDLTHKICDVVKLNNSLKQAIASNKSRKEIEGMSMLLQFHVATFADNQLPGVSPSQHRNGRPIKSVTERLKSKEGRIRGNLMGKRVDFSARSVITPDPNISIDELGMPLRIAMNLTMPEPVLPLNQVRLQSMVDNGPDVYPGAKFVHKADGRTIRLHREMERGFVVLEVGDVVDRHLVNGDPVLFNRQPSLHKMSMMAHRVRVMDFATFRLNVLVTTPYNADYDGDEMNCHVPQSMQTAMELQELAAVPLQILSPRLSAPIITIVQDVALGIHLLTQPGVKLPLRLAQNLLSVVTEFDGRSQRAAPMLLGAAGPTNEAGLPGTDVASHVVPRGTYLSDKRVDVLNGRLVRGQLSKVVYSEGDNNLIQTTFKELGPDATRRLLDNTQRIVCEWLCSHGFSVGISDLMIPKAVRAQASAILADYRAKVDAILMSVHENSFNNNTIGTNQEYFEDSIKAALARASDDVSKLIPRNPGNRLVSMIQAKSKGKDVNLQQMMMILGQQSVEDDASREKGRVGYGFDGRTLPHFTKYDDSPEARGFVQNCYLQGLSPYEFFFHAIAGREGLIDTAVRSVTWETRVLILEGGICKDVCIGEWIDTHLERARAAGREVQLYPKDRNLELCELDTEVFIPTVDEDGRVTWGRMTAVTRHDPGERLYKVKTRGGREVTVAESKSLLVWQKETRKFMPVDSPKVKVGDALPVVARLMAPPDDRIVHFIDMAKFFPKSEYVHGTEYNKAAAAVKTAQADKYHIPRGWFKQNNGSTFTVPYPSKARFQRACFSGRSDATGIMDGFIYPFHANREVGLADKFELDWDNGAFIGLFLADGHTSTKAGQVGISKNDTSVQNWVKAWFEERGMATKLVTHTNKRGSSQTIFGYSTLLARFLDAFVGAGSHIKHVPAVAFNAPDGFICGLLSGYFSGDGTVERGALAASSVSRRLLEGITLLCSRVGAFGKLSTVMAENHLRDNVQPDYRLKVRAQWGQRLADELKLILPAKRDLLSTMAFSNTHRNYAEQEDVVLDKIESIEVIGVKDHPKLYDVTIPETLNFILFNGLGVHDTSDTGYIQRKLVKAMEDCKVHHDMTVRNINGVVVQYTYGGDGFDSAKLERQPYHVLNMSLGEIQAEFGLPAEDLPALRACMTPEAFSACAGTPALEAALTEVFDKYWRQVLEDRRVFVDHVSGRKRYITKEMEFCVYFPINFRRAILYADKKFRCSAKGLSDLEPAEVLVQVESMLAELMPGKKQDTNVMFGVLARAYLNPKALICRNRLTRAAFTYLLDKLRLTYYSSLAPPAELVGIIAAQSASEGSTQLTLNSVVHETKLLLKVNGELQEVTIGEFVDARVDAALEAEEEQGAKGLLEQHPNDTWLAYIKDADVQVLSCDKRGKVSWRRVEAVTKHPVVNRDGSNTLLKVVTRTGREVTATKAKSFLKRIDNQVLPVDGEDLRVGDRLPVSRVLPLEGMEITHFDLSKYLPKTEYIYMSEVEKALKYAGQPSWWKLHYGKEFTLPYGRPDSFYATFATRNKKQAYEPGCIYPKWASRVPSHIPERISLDEDFGFFVGAFLAEGHAIKHAVLIANVDMAYLARIENFCKRYHISYHIETRFINNGAFTTLRIPCTILGTLMRAQFGELSQHKRMPAELLAAPKPFLREVINGYFARDGSVANSTSRQLLESIRQVLVRFDIVSSITVNKPEKRTHFKSTPQQSYMLCMSVGDTQRFAKQFEPVIKYKQEHLDAILARTCSRPYPNFTDYVPDVVLSNSTRALLRRDKIPELLARATCAADRAVLEGVLAEEVLWDEIVSIEEVRSPHKYVYDLTVEGTRIFMQFSGLVLEDTFHQAGNQQATKAVQGVPRLKELLSASKNMKTQQMHIHLVRSIAQDAAAASQVLNDVCTTHLRDVVSESAVFYDPSDASTDIDDDRRFVEAWHEFNRTTGCVDNIASPWLLRFTFDKEKMLRRGLTMLDVYFAITTSTVDNVSCVFSDDNAAKLVMRVRMEESKARDVMYDVKLLEQQLLNDLMLKGITGIRKVVKSQVTRSDQAFDGDATAFTSWKEFVLVTDGSNLRDVLGHPLVDKHQTTTNDVQDIYAVLGVEAARAAIMAEIKTCLADLMVQDRHLELLVDVMTMRGTLMSIERHGVNKGDIGPLAKCSFEESDKNLIHAGIFAELDRVAGVSANIMLGQIPCAGTGDSKILMDMERLTRDYVEDGPGMGVAERMGKGAGLGGPGTSGDCKAALESSVFDFKPQGGYIADEL